MSTKSVQQECQARVSRKSVKKECQARVSSKCQARVSRKECQAKVSRKSVLTRVSSKSVKQECPAKVSSRSVQQECQARVSRKSVQQECQARESFQEWLARRCASHLHKEKTSILISALVFVHSALHKVTAFGFVGSIRFFSCQPVLFP